ncbi:MAG TPA: ATP-grasp domain-containing protein, partial [Chloroflexota bacterium]|nr:ATP-grasp domain-containing protein [Chloroflexota bacterium]
MRLKEYEGKRILQSMGVALPKGKLVETPAQARAAAQEIGGPVVLKVQVLATGRGKVGGVRFADTPEQAEQVAAQMLGMQIKGYTVQQLLVEEKLDVAQEIYVAATFEEATKGRLMMASASGGMDINEVAEKDPNLIKRVHMDAWIDMHPFQAKELAFGLGLTGKVNSAAQSLFLKLWATFVRFDAILAEINPVVVAKDGRVVAADAHIEIEGDSMFRQKDRLAALEIYDRDDNAKPPTPFEIEALKIDKADYRGVAGRVVEFPGSLG